MKALALLRLTLRDSLALWRLAAWIPLIAVLTEFAQHVVEVDLGMFVSKEAFKALQMDPLRWQWGYVKMAGLLIAWFAALVFWARRDGAKPLWSRAGLALALNVAVGLVPLVLALVLGEPVLTAANTVVMIATLPLLPFLAGALFGDEAMTLRQSYRSGWWIAVRMILLSAVGFVVLQAIHMINHNLASGAPAPLLWTLMVWDSLVVGMIAAWLGTAQYRGYTGMPARS